MERAVALRKLNKLLGKHLGYRVNDKAPTPEERAAADAELPAVRVERDVLDKKVNARRREILAADAEYQKLQAEYLVARNRADKLSGMTRHYKITVGTSNGMFFTIKAEGDSWEEVIGKVESKAREDVR